jgi:hypothetical protein
MRVGELKTILSIFPDSTPLVSVGFDACGEGYDAIYSTHIEVKMFDDTADNDLTMYLGHLLITW